MIKMIWQESASGNRQRRAADKKGKGKGKGEKGKDGKKTKKAKGKKRRNRNGKPKKRTRKQQNKQAEKAAVRAEKKAEKEAKKEAKRADRKAKKEANKESSNAEKDGRKKALSKLGLKKMPSKSTLEKLTCVHDKITELLIRCAKNILSKTNQMCKEKIEKKERKIHLPHKHKLLTKIMLNTKLYSRDKSLTPSTIVIMFCKKNILNVFHFSIYKMMIQYLFMNLICTVLEVVLEE